VSSGKTNKQIGEELYISEKTVKNIRYKICKRLSIKGHYSLFRVSLQMRYDK
jgi:DNA-binding NarL/FixJ family response regulator